MTKQHPITPPPELVQQWFDTATKNEGRSSEGWPLRLANYAAQWGADQELEACCEWLIQHYILSPEGEYLPLLRKARRPKPPSLKQQALQTLKYPKDLWSEAEVDTIRRALEALPDD